MSSVLSDAVKNKVWQIRVPEDWLARLKLAAERKGVSAAAYLRMVAANQMDADGIPHVEPKRKKRPPTSED